MNSASATQHGRRIQDLFSKVGGSNYMEQDPLSFEANEDKGKVDPKQLKADYVQLFCDIAGSTLGSEYLHSLVPVHGIDPSTLVNPEDGKRLLLHPLGVKPLATAHVYYFNQWTFSCEGLGDLPLIQVQSYDFRTPRFDKDESSVFLRFTKGTLDNKRALFDSFEKAIGLSGLPYKRNHSHRSLESLDFDLEYSPREAVELGF